MLTIKTSELEKIAEGLRKIILASDQRPKDIPVPIQYWAFRLSKKIDPELKILSEIKIPLLKRYGMEIMQSQPNQTVKDTEGKMIPATISTGRYRFNSNEDRLSYEKDTEKVFDTDITIEGNIFKKKFSEIISLGLGGSILFELESVLDEDEVGMAEKVEKEIIK